MNLKETIIKVLKEEKSKRDLSYVIKELVQFIIEDNKDILCDIEVVPPWYIKTIDGHLSNMYKLTFIFIGGYDTKFWPRSMAIRDKEAKIMNDTWDLVYNFLGESVHMYSKLIKNCEQNINKKEDSVMSLTEEKNVDNKVKDIILNADDWDDFIKALGIKYGDTVPLYHATTVETSKIIDREGFKLTYGKNYKSFAKEPLIYFQIGESDYVASNRPVLYRLDVPLDFIASYADIDMDNVDTSDEDLESVGIDMKYWDDMSYEIKDVITYFVWNNMTLDGMELLITDRNGDGDIFKGLTPVKIEQESNNINEGVEERMMELVNSTGLFGAVKFVGGYDTLIKLMGENNIPKYIKVDSIKEFMKDIDDIYFGEFGIEPIPYGESNSEYREIVHLGRLKVGIDVWGGYNNQTHKGEYAITYSGLSDNILDEIISILIEIDKILE